MKLLNLDLDNMHLLSRFTENGLELTIGNPLKGAYNKVMLCNKVNGHEFSGQEHLDGYFDLIMCGNNTKMFGFVANNSKKKSNKKYNALFTGVYSFDCKSVTQSITILADKNLIKETDIIALGVLPTCDNYLANRLSFPVSVLLINKDCDYKIGDTIFSGRTGEIIESSKNTDAYLVEDVILGCIAKKYHNNSLKLYKGV